MNDFDGADWVGIIGAIGLAVLLSCVGVGFIVSNMNKADLFAACSTRGGEMVKTDGEWQCKGGNRGGQ